ncbi:effector-associated constant component EACC1 [Nonomuraea bangladeshensis]|uniref:effector-associated constant component EACC1 n=1 Tax=Nonomuraea bangladeshensis TaxID=404385 RepID=UPI003C2D78C5
MPYSGGFSERGSDLRIEVQVRSIGKSGEPQAELARYLNSQEKLRGRAHLTGGGSRTAPGVSQPISMIVLDLLGPAGVAFAAAAIAWLRHRTADTKITVRRADGLEFEISAQRVRRLGPKELSALAEQLGKLATEPVTQGSGGPSRQAAEPASPAGAPETPAVTSAQSDGVPAALAELQQVDDA